MDPFVAEIRMFGFEYAPRGWAFCDGQLLPAAQNQALFSLIGFTYGGDGRSTFALPDLRGRGPVGTGQGTGLSRWNAGQSAGAETVALTINQIPSHSHGLAATSARATGTGAAGQQLATGLKGTLQSSVQTKLYSAAGPDRDLDANAVGETGRGEGHANMMPYLTMNFCIALIGIFPSRP